MKVRVKFIGFAAGERPEGEATEIALAEGATLADALSALGLAGAEGVMTLHGDEPVPAGRRAATALRQGDEITVFAPLKGG